ncbi:cell division protein FtsX [Patescibacteria group bacterium]
MKLLKVTWKYIRRSPYQALAAIMVMTLALFTSATFSLVALGSAKILNFFETRPQVIVFLKDEMSKKEIDKLTFKLLGSGKVEAIKHISKEEALRIYEEQNQADPLLLEMVSAEILPASLEISAREIGYLEEIALILKEEAGVEEVSFQKDVVAVLEKITRGIKIGGGGLIIFLGFVSFWVVLIIVGMKASMRRREVKIMKLLGATNSYIWGPFLLEGVFYGLLSSLFAWGATWLLLAWLTPFLADFLTGISLLPVPVPVMLLVLLGLTFEGVFIGSLGSLLAVKRYS